MATSAISDIDHLLRSLAAAERAKEAAETETSQSAPSDRGGATPPSIPVKPAPVSAAPPRTPPISADDTQPVSTAAVRERAASATVRELRAESSASATPSAPAAANAGSRSSVIVKGRGTAGGGANPSHSGSSIIKMLSGGSRVRQSYVPLRPETLQDAGLHESDINDLILKFLLHRGVETGFKISVQIGLRFPIVEALLRQLKLDRMLQYKNAIAGGDYLYELTELGRERARALAEGCTYFGTAPVPLDQYIASVKAQSIDGRKPTLDDIRNAFSDLNINDRLLSNIGQAIHSGRGMFLYGAPGNGKTSMAERITKSFGDCIWIPRAITAAGEIIRMFDPNRHRPIVLSDDERERTDGRWVLIERPTVIVGGELRMENLEITYIRKTGIGEAPLQMKANCGTLLIDDFGRQRISTDELLNRWIVPLEQRHDFLHLESGRTIQVPFDQLIIFSSNLEPRDLVDDAFLRRIPYKIEVKDPTEKEFREVFEDMSQKLGFECPPEALDYLIAKHYVGAKRGFRFCHPRDLLRQVENRCTLHQLPRIVTNDALDQAVENYFSIM